MRLQIAGEMPEASVENLAGDLQRAGVTTLHIEKLENRGWVARLIRSDSSMPTKELAFPTVVFRSEATAEDYSLRVEADQIVASGAGKPGLFYALQTLSQLVRANMQQRQIPCVEIQDWPSLRWRAFQDDLTRGPSTRLEILKAQVALGAYFKYNLFTYYMEYQFAFRKHPKIGPENGSLLPDELRALVEYARDYFVEILGNQQSFAHFHWILRHPEYAHLRESPVVLCPIYEETYQLLDDLYSEVCPLLPFEMFNVCCDETFDLGKGPSKELAAEIGVGGVYLRHILRIHRLMKEKYGKRMMMWGDIILKHPEHIPQVPKDVVMLTWGYSPRESFEDQIIPFVRSGHEFFVCPGISNWSRILPDFGVATVNIRNFVRDGLRHGAIGMLNTGWEDDGEALHGYNWHGYAWGADCAWTGSETSPEDFNRRIGAVLFGEEGDRFGRAIELLAQAHRLPNMEGMNNRRFWRPDFSPQSNPETQRQAAESLLKIVHPAIQHLEVCRQEARTNREFLDAFLHGARRMELIANRMLDGIQVAELYEKARQSSGEKAVPLIDEALSLVAKNRRAHRELGEEFRRIWLSESKPYALDWTMARYQAMDTRFQKLEQELREARRLAETGQSLPSMEQWD